MTGQTKARQNRVVERWNAVPVPEAVAKRAISNIDVDSEGCWNSRYSVGSHGYAQIGWWRDGKSHMVLAHRAAWSAVNGQVPLSLTLDHTCKVRRCVNPDHLRLLPNYENARRHSGKDWPIGTCINGHDATHLVPVPRTNKSGGPRTAWECGPCKEIHRKNDSERRKVSHA